MMMMMMMTMTIMISKCNHSDMANSNTMLYYINSYPVVK